jgi:hypothetical protein
MVTHSTATAEQPSTHALATNAARRNFMQLHVSSKAQAVCHAVGLLLKGKL